MRKQIIYQKTGRLRFVGHLDFMRTMHRAMTRAGIPLAYSQGFNPHPHMSFAGPLTLGWDGLGEIMEIKTEKDISDTELLQSLSRELPEGIRLLGCQTLDEKEPPIMAKIQAAAYRIDLPEERDWTEPVNEFLSQESIRLTKIGKIKGRKQEVEVEVRPWIYSWTLTDPHTLELVCASGSEQNLKPDLLIYALYRFIGAEDLKYREHITRCSLFGRDPQGNLINYSDPGAVSGRRELA